MIASRYEVCGCWTASCLNRWRISVSTTYTARAWTTYCFFPTLTNCFTLNNKNQILDPTILYIWIILITMTHNMKFNVVIHPCSGMNEWKVGRRSRDAPVPPALEWHGKCCLQNLLVIFWHQDSSKRKN